MKLTSLLENTSACEGIRAEHGLSLYIETRGHKLLFDMGQTDLFYQNAGALGVALSDVDLAVLSHGHYDHGGGLLKFLEINEKAPVYVSRYAFGPYYNGTEKYIGLDLALMGKKRLVYTDGMTVIGEGLTLYSCNGKARRYDLGSFGLNRKEGERFLPDEFLHEQYLLIEEEGKRVLISGCSHKGILNIAGWFEPDVLVGGFHFSKLPLDDTLKQYAEILNSHKTKYYTCHCTGTEQFAFMKQYMDHMEYLSCGQTIEV